MNPDRYANALSEFYAVSKGQFAVLQYVPFADLERSKVKVKDAKC